MLNTILLAMLSILALTGISQLLLFMGIGLILFGWIEKKEKLILAGQISFLILGIFSIWILQSNGINVPTIVQGKVSKELKLVEFFRINVIFFALTLGSFLVSTLRFKFQKISISILLIFALFLFFMLFNIQQMPNIPA